MPFILHDIGLAGAVVNWREALLERMSMAVSKYLQTPRLIVSGAVSAWIEISSLEDGQKREQWRLALAEKTLESILDNHDEGTRAAPFAMSVSDAKGLGDNLAELLLKTDMNGSMP